MYHNACHILVTCEYLFSERINAYQLNSLVSLFFLQVSAYMSFPPESFKSLALEESHIPTRSLYSRKYFVFVLVFFFLSVVFTFISTNKNVNIHSQGPYVRTG